MWISRVALALACLGLAAVRSAGADVIYQYTGKPFQSVIAPYTTSDFVSGTLQLSSKLAGNLTGMDVSSLITAFSFSDGVQTATQNDPPRFDTGDTGNIAIVSTDANGNITVWRVQFCSTVPPNPDCVTAGNDPNGFESDFDEGTFFFNGQATFGETGLHGSWATVPEPSTGSLSALSLLMLSAVTRAKSGRLRIKTDRRHAAIAWEGGRHGSDT